MVIPDQLSNILCDYRPNILVVAEREATLEEFQRLVRQSNVLLTTARTLGEARRKCAADWFACIYIERSLGCSSGYSTVLSIPKTHRPGAVYFVDRRSEWRGPVSFSFREHDGAIALPIGLGQVLGHIDVAIRKIARAPGVILPLPH